MKITAIGIDLAKSIFQVHGVNSAGKAVLRKKIARSQLLPFMAQLPKCLIGMEACGGANYWAREFEKLGHEVRLIAPQFVKPFVKSNKNDVADAEAIVEAVSRPSMRFVSPKRIDQQDVQSIHRARSRRVAARTALVNEIRGLLSEYGIVLPVGIQKFRKELIGSVEKGQNEGRLTLRTGQLIESLWREVQFLDEGIMELQKNLERVHSESEECQRLEKIPGVGVLSATAVTASVGNPQQFKNGREFAAWIGLVPRQNSSGGKERLLGISKRGDIYLRTLLIHGARATIRHLDRQPETKRKEWLKKLIERRGMNRAVVALANKNARTIWVLLARKEEYKMAA